MNSEFLKKVSVFIAFVFGILLILILFVLFSIVIFHRDLLNSFDFKSDNFWIILLLIVSFFSAICLYFSIYPLKSFKKNTETGKGIVLTETGKFYFYKILDFLKSGSLILALIGGTILLDNAQFSNIASALLIILAVLFWYGISRKKHKNFYYFLIFILVIYPYTLGKFIGRTEHFSGYVYAFPDINKAKNYRLRADMTKTRNLIFVNKIYFNNGGYITFDEDYNLEQSDEDNPLYIIPGNSSCVIHYDADNDQEWCIRYFGEEIKNKSKGISEPKVKSKPKKLLL